MTLAAPTLGVSVQLSGLRSRNSLLRTYSSWAPMPMPPSRAISSNGLTSPIATRIIWFATALGSSGPQLITQLLFRPDASVPGTKCRLDYRVTLSIGWKPLPVCTELGF